MLGKPGRGWPQLISYNMYALADIQVVRKNTGSTISLPRPLSSNDGFRPVSFYLEVID